MGPHPSQRRVDAAMSEPISTAKMNLYLMGALACMGILFEPMGWSYQDRVVLVPIFFAGVFLGRAMNL